MALLLANIERAPDSSAAIQSEIRQLEADANPLDQAASDTRVRRLAYLRRELRKSGSGADRRKSVVAKLGDCAVSLQSMKIDLLRLSAGADTPQHVTSLALEAMALAESVDGALEAARLSDELSRGAGERAAGASDSFIKVTDYLHDRVTAAIGSQYLVAGEIGRGSSGVVYRATDIRLNRLVAIKILPPELGYNPDVRTRFVREAQTAAQLSHPNIVPIYSVDERDGLVYFVMALVEGESVAAGLAREPRWPIERTIRTLREVADGLAYAHSRGVVHRDIKPDNILIDRASGRALVTDFGIARAAAVDTRLTVTGMSLGTPAYMSPEQAIGERELDGRSDLYSLGVVGFQMLVGETPFRATSTLAMMRMHVSDPPPRVRDRRPDVPAYVASAIDRCLEKRPEDRWSSASEFHDALAEAAPQPSSRDARPNQCPHLPSPPSPRRGGSRRF